jgi:hypothetical protein
MIMDYKDILRRKAHSLFGGIEFAKEAHDKINAIDEAYSDCSLVHSVEAMEITKSAFEIKRQILRLKEKLEQL